MGLFGKKKKSGLNQANNGGWDPNIDGGWNPPDNGGWNPPDDGGWNPPDDGGWNPPDDGGWDPNPPQGNTVPTRKRKGFDPSGLIAILVMVIVIGLLYVGISSIIGPRGGQSKEVIADLQSSVNNLDSERFNNTLEPDTKRVTQVYFETLQSTTEADLSNAFAMALNTICPDMIPNEPDESVTYLLKNMEIVPVKLGLPGKTRKVKCKVQLDGELYENIIISLRKNDGVPCIKSIELTK